VARTLEQARPSDAVAGEGSREAEAERSSSALHTLALITLIAGVLQAVAVIVLGTSEVDDVQRAAAEGSRAYVLAALISVACLWGVYAFRRKPTISLPLLLAWPVLVFLPLRGALSPLGLAYHGEFITYHFLGLVGAALCVWVPLRWVRSPELRARIGVSRWVPFVASTLGTAALLVAQVAGIPSLRLSVASGLAAAGAMLMLTTWAAAVATTWTVARPSGPRLAAALLMLPVATRVLFTGTGGVGAGLRGAPVHPDAMTWVGLAIVLVAAVVAALLRPRLEIWLQGLIAVVCMIAVGMLWIGYTYMFGVLEDGLDGIARSFLGFSLPYPAYVSTWQVFGFMLGLFFILATIYTCLVSSRDRNRGVALGLLAVAGIGLSSPHLVLLMAAGILSFVDTLVDPVQQRLADGDDDGESQGSTPAKSTGAFDVGELVEHLGRRLGAPESIGVDDVSVLRDDLDGVTYEVRARGGRRLELLLTVGLPGRGAPAFELVPDRGQGGQRPAHLLARTHRVAGDARALEAFGDRPLDALTRLPGARIRAWEAGWEIELSGREALAQADADALESVVRAVARAVRG